MCHCVWALSYPEHKLDVLYQKLGRCPRAFSIFLHHHTHLPQPLLPCTCGPIFLTEQPESFVSFLFSPMRQGFSV